MKICGLQKMTLLDYPGQVACTVFLGGCDMRCPFCHNAEILDPSAPSATEEEELLAFLQSRKGMLDGVVITGGEPLMHEELPSLLQKIRGMGFLIKVDTNGNHPEMLRDILNGGLADYVAMDIKNSPERYGATVGLPAFRTGRIEQSIRILLEGSVPCEFRTTVVRPLHDASSFAAIGPWIRGAERYYLQPFTDRNTVPFSGLETPSGEELEHYVKMVEPYVKKAAIRGL